MEERGIVIGPHANLFRKMRGTHYRDRKQLGLDFSRLRNLVMPGDKRQLQDIRRSANIEMKLGEATPQERAELLANTLDKSKFLDETYTPPTVALSRQMADKRRAGRAALAAANGTKLESSGQDSGNELESYRASKTGGKNGP